MKNGFLTLSAITLALSTSAIYANDASVIPEQKPGYAISLTGLYLEPSASNLVYALYTNPLPTPAPNWEQRVVNPAYSPAFDLGLQYNLKNNRENVRFDWLHFKSNDKATAWSGDHTTVGPIYYFGPTEQFLLNTAANSTVKFHIENGNLVFGHLIDLSNHIQIEPFFGVSAVYLKQTIDNTYTGADPILGPYSHEVNTQSEFIGFGPRIGFDASYFITNRFAIIGNFAGDLLSGEIKYNTDFTSFGSSVGNTVATKTSMANQNTNRIVPEMDAKIALLYKFPVQSNSEVTLQAGYLYSVYFNGVTEVLPSSLVPTAWEAGSVAIITQSQQQSNVDLRGPFVSVSWKF